MERVAVQLERVPETLLWTLYHRAVEARRADAVLHDPVAVELLERIDYPFEARFGSGERLSQWQALRARCFDNAVRRFLADHPDGTVVALGEGLETQFWRVDDERVHWLTVDLPEVVELRRRLLPENRRLRSIGCSALEPSWLAEVDTTGGVLDLRRQFSRQRNGLRRRTALARRAKPERAVEDEGGVRAAALVVGRRP
jgi:O-methyltransferase involved in polyketide biosynthesis